MITAKVTVRVNRTELRQTMARQARRVVDEATDRIAVRARQLAPEASGRLRQSIRSEPARMDSPTVAQGRVVALAPHALWQHEGTGIYGPRRRRIHPRRGRVLRFYWKKAGRVVFYRSVAGVKGTKYLTRAVNEVLNSPPWVIEYFTPIST